MPTYLEQCSIHLSPPANITVDNNGLIYVADVNNHRIRLIRPDRTVCTYSGNPDYGLVGGFADGPSSKAKFNGSRGIALDNQGNVYIADTQNHAIRKITPFGEVTTIAGINEAGYVDGLADQARFSYPSDIAVDSVGNIYVVDTSNHCIGKISSEGQVTTIARTSKPGSHDGPSLEAQFRLPEGIALDKDGNILVADPGNQRIRKIILS